MTDKGDTHHVSLYVTLLYFNRTQLKLKIHNKMGIAVKSGTFASVKNAQNSSKRIIGQRIDIRILPK